MACRHRKNETASNFGAKFASHCLLTSQGEEKTTISRKTATGKLN